MCLRIAALFCVVCSSSLASQVLPTSGFVAGQNVVGAVVGLGNIGAASASFGGRFERGLKQLPDLGNGVLSFALDVDYYRYTDSFGVGSLLYLPIGGSINYHFRLDDRRWDPFVGAGLGYIVARLSDGAETVSGGSGLYAITRVGGRYFYSPRLAFQADAGVGATTLNLGIV